MVDSRFTVPPPSPLRAVCQVLFRHICVRFGQNCNAPYRSRLQFFCIRSAPRRKKSLRPECLESVPSFSWCSPLIVYQPRRAGGVMRLGSEHLAFHFSIFSELDPQAKHLTSSGMFTSPGSAIRSKCTAWPPQCGQGFKLFLFIYPTPYSSWITLWSAL